MPPLLVALYFLNILTESGLTFLLVMQEMRTMKYFGTDGIRGRFGQEPITESFAQTLGYALGQWMQTRLGKGPKRVLIGRDTRASGITLEHAICEGLKRFEGEVVCLGIMPTPAVSFQVRAQDADLGIVLTASHNPHIDNGIKLFDRGGIKFTIADEAEIEDVIDQQTTSLPEATPGKVINHEMFEGYFEAVQSVLPQQALKGFKIVVDTAHGATCQTTPKVLAHLGAEVIAFGGEPNGHNINDGVGSEHPERLCQKVIETKADVGIAHDGDGDRVVICDEQGRCIPGDILLMLLGEDAIHHNALANNTLVVTVQSNLALDRTIEAAGGTVVRTPVGDRNVLHAMREHGSNLGGENSGHIIMYDVAPCGDGLVAALKLLGLRVRSGKPLSSLWKDKKLFPQISKNVQVLSKKPLESLPSLRDAIKTLERSFEGRGRVLVRYSGTEPKIRLLVEGETEDLIVPAMEMLETAVRKDLDVLDD